LAQFSPPAAASLSASSIPSAQVVQPDAFRALLAAGKSPRPVVLQVGSRIMFAQAHIPGAVYAGPGSQPAGLDLLSAKVAALPKDAFIVLYCGCCPWNHCPNIGAAFHRLQQLGFHNVRALYIPSNFGDDWANKGYPVEKGL
jgi:rhodanese-related sulfurtransferase